MSTRGTISSRFNGAHWRAALVLFVGLAACPSAAFAGGVSGQSGGASGGANRVVPEARARVRRAPVPAPSNTSKSAPAPTQRPAAPRVRRARPTPVPESQPATTEATTLDTTPTDDAAEKVIELVPAPEPSVPAEVPAARTGSLTFKRSSHPMPLAVTLIVLGGFSLLGSLFGAGLRLQRRVLRSS